MASAATIVVGVILVAAPEAPLLAAYNRSVARAFWAQPQLPDAVRAYHRWTFGILGAAVAGWVCVTPAFSSIRLPGVNAGLSPRSLPASPRGSPWTSSCRCEQGCRAKLSSCPQLCWRSEFPCSSYGRTFAAVPPDALDPTAAQPDHLRPGAGGRRLAAMMSSPQMKATWPW